VHILLTDRLTCPRCGPDFGLILLAKRLAERRVLDGALGCPNCRDHFPIRGGFADLRPPPRDPLTATPPAADPGAEATNRLAALLGVLEGPGTVALLGSVAVHAAALADRLPEIEVVAVGAATHAEVERDRVSRLVTGVELPFHPWTFRALATGGDVVAPEEAVRVVGHGGRVVMERPGPGATAQFERAGSRILLQEGGWVVALRETR
jgi:uncharacterized protein YbaR (Trm112 family)